MHKRAQLTTQIVLSIVVLVLIILLVALSTKSQMTGQTTTSTQTQQSTQATYKVIYKNCEPCYNDRHYYEDYYYDDCYYYDDNYKDCYYDSHYEPIELKYSSYKSTEIREGVFGNDIKDYIVEVKNRDRVSGDFIVRFTFYDDKGHKITRAMTKHVQPGKTQEFVIQDIYGSGNYRGWTYEVFASSKSISKTRHYCD